MFTHVCSSSMYSHAFSFFFFFFFNDTATTEIYTLSLHDALPIYIILVGKGVASGYAPLGAVLVSARVVAAFERGSGAFMHGFTYQAHAVSTAAGNAVLDYLESHKLFDRVNTAGQKLCAALSPLQSPPNVGDIR